MDEKLKGNNPIVESDSTSTEDLIITCLSVIKNNKEFIKHEKNDPKGYIDMAVKENQDASDILSICVNIDKNGQWCNAYPNMDMLNQLRKIYLHTTNANLHDSTHEYYMKYAMSIFFPTVCFKDNKYCVTLYGVITIDPYSHNCYFVYRDKDNNLYLSNTIDSRSIVFDDPIKAIKFINSKEIKELMADHKRIDYDDIY